MTPSLQLLHPDTLLPDTHPHVKLSAFVARLDLEDVEGAGVARGGLHLEDVCRHTAPRRQVHVSVENSEGFVPAGRVLSRAQALTVVAGEAETGRESDICGCVRCKMNPSAKTLTFQKLRCKVRDTVMGSGMYSLPGN